MAQAEQLEEPDCIVLYPASQNEHAMAGAAELNFPMAQGTQDEADDDGAMEPALQAVHTVWPVPE